MTALGVHQFDKALPPPVKESLPPTPPQDSFSSSPLLPPKSNPRYGPSPLSDRLRPPPAPINVPPPDDFLGKGDALCSFLYRRFSSCVLPLGPNTSPGTPNSPATSDMPVKRTNPLVDLIETEKLYVDQLTGIIRVRYPYATSMGFVFASSHG